jgi:gliding motility-associated-like protein
VAYPVNANNLIRSCDDNHDGVFSFDTSGIQAAVLNGQTGVNVTYFREDGSSIMPFTNPYFVTGSETITIRVNNNSTQTGGQPCYDEVVLQFIVDDLPEAFAVPTALTTICDDEANSIDQDGLFDFDTSGFLSIIIGTQTGMNVYYYDENNVLIPSATPNQLPNPFRTATQNVTVVVENSINNTCTAQVIIPFVVNPTPKIDQEESIIICIPDTQALIDAGIVDGTPIANYTYQWYFNNAIMPGQTGYSITVSSPGVYSVTVTNTFGCTKTRIITVSGSEIATVESIEVIDLSEINSISVIVSGLGDYEYALNDINGPYQDFGFFNNVPMGLYQLYIRDKNGCGLLGPIEIPVLGIPKYFTPNGDGFHDYWNVKGVSLFSNSNAIIYIFDRYGKLLKQLSAISAGWDGTYNGNQMPGDDYWYSIQFDDGRNVKGHFALKR